MAPASLKHREHCGGRAGRFLFPGLHGPGLIEARWNCQLTSEFTPHFRGCMAPASLKQPYAVLHDCSVIHFRGCMAPASLKRSRRANPGQNGRTFPGLHGPGLIEAKARSARVLRRGRFPGLHGPGLIEARTPAGRRPARGSFPGLRGPGLIEAAPRWWIGRRRRRISGAAWPRPH